ncbi:MAG: glycosyltransferase family 2 protein, partial [Bacteroidales bacterium]|nr:glycosyltransferase family 2 protein [Bacteroidales bacterium]
MNLAEFYRNRYSVGPQIFNDNPRIDTGIIVVIPCYDDEHIFTTLDSLDNADQPPCTVEVIVVVNSAEDTPSGIISKNRDIYSRLCKITGKFSNFALKPHIIEGVCHKFAGVGNARKTGMDEAVDRFTKIENEKGIIVSLDSDCLVAKGYFVKI